MKLNKKGFVSSAVLYSLLLLFLALVLGLLALLSNRKQILDKLKGDIKSEINQTKNYKKYENGTAIYYNPVTGKMCGDYKEENSKTGVTEGCLKWYIFNDDKNKATVNMILDHNTSGNVAWASLEDYIEAGGTEEEYGENGKNIKGPLTVTKRLNEDTENWKNKARLITADEIAKITGAAEILKWSSNKTYGTNIETESSWFYLDGVGTTYTEWQTQVANSTTKSKYAWLFDNNGGCKNYGCNFEDNDKYPYGTKDSENTSAIWGYWTSTPLNGISKENAWYISTNGNLGNKTVSMNDTRGVRPVITVSKKDINPIIEKAESLVYNSNGKCKTDGTTYSYMGGCYIKGTSTNNYAWYNGFMWRIMGINSDGTVRLITDENVTAIPYGAANTAESYKENEDYIHDWLNTYFLGKLNSTKSIIKQGNYFCSETVDSKLTDDTVRDKCTSGKEVKAKVGLISYDEYYLAGLSSSYLNIKQVFWTMTPKTTSSAWFVYNDGIINGSVVTFASGVRPVINVEATSTITEGDGTTSNYYVLVEDKTSDKIGTISSVVTSGEYVSLEGKTYRVVSKDTDGVKLILDGYYDTNVAYGSDNTFTTTSGIGATLNGDVLTWLGLSDSTKIKETNWYQGTAMSNGYTYKTPLTEAEGTGINAKVGLIRIGEMLSSQSSTLLTVNYTKISDFNNLKRYWTMNKSTSDTNVWFLYTAGSADSSSLTDTYAIRPVIVVDSTLPINGGTGTWDNPYEI